MAGIARSIVLDRAHALRVTDGRADGIRQVHAQALRALVHTVVVDRHRDGLAALSSRKVQRARRARVVLVQARLGRAVRKRKVHRRGQRSRARLGHRERHRPRRLVDRHIVDRKTRQNIYHIGNIDRQCGG